MLSLQHSLLKKVEIGLLIRWYSCPNSCFRIIAIDYHVQCKTHTSFLSGKAPLFSARCTWILFCLHASDKMCLCLSNLHRVLRWVWRYFLLLTNNIWHHLLNSAVVSLRFPDTCGYYKSFLKYRISACAQQPPSSGNQILKACDWGGIFPKCTTSIWYSWGGKGTEREPGKIKFENSNQPSGQNFIPNFINNFIW